MFPTKTTKRLLWILMSVWGLSSMLIVLASSNLSHNQCGAVLEFQSDNELTTNMTRYDFTTGITLVEEQNLSDAHFISPNGRYRYDIPWYTGNDNDVFLVLLESASREQVYSSPFITSVLWSYDSQALLIWEFDGTREVTMVTSLDIETNDPLFSHEFPPTLGRRRLSSPDNHYIYAQYPLDVMQFTHGIIFVDTVTGDITRFAEPTEFPYRWSDDNRWIASHFQDTFSIIDPQTGDFHANFSEPIRGENSIWHGDEIWFTRPNSIDSYDVWQASLNTGVTERRIENASLENLSDDATWATIINSETGDVDLYNFMTRNRYPLNIAKLLPTHRIQVNYSPDNACVALLISAYRNPVMNELRIINLHIMQTTHQQYLNPDYYDLRWIVQT